MTVKVEVELPDPPEGYQWVGGSGRNDGDSVTRWFILRPIHRPKVVRYEWAGLYEDPSQAKFQSDEWYFMANAESREPARCCDAGENFLEPRWILRRIEEES